MRGKSPKFFSPLLKKSTYTILAAAFITGSQNYVHCSSGSYKALRGTEGSQ